MQLCPVRLGFSLWPVGEIGLKLGADPHHLHAGSLGRFSHRLHQPIAILKRSLINVGHVDLGFDGQEAKARQDRLLLSVLCDPLGSIPTSQCLMKALQQPQLNFVLLGLSLARSAHLVETLFDRSQVSERQLQIYDLYVGAGVEFFGYVRDVRCPEAAHYHGDGVHGADVAQELVAQSLPVARPLDQACDIQELDGSRCDFLRVHQGGDPLQSFVGNLQHTHVGFYGGEGIGRHLGTRTGESVE